ncbi:MAG: trehalose-binding protein [Desulfovibrionaceae bacterium]|nr:trehalose-binding protein [Desulfovibrionaceae bacterium]MBF0514269.1 trehalose-binding protein [Desulfovibrionaceae bacterium]
MDKAAAFHGNPAPGLIIGGYMVERAKSLLPAGTLFEALVETPKCLPDAVQLLSLCSTGNGWMRVLNLGRYAVTLYDKYTGEGVRVHLDPAKLEAWPEIKSWLLKLKPKAEQDKGKLLDAIRRAGDSILADRPVTITPRHLGKSSMGAVGICPVCHEAYPAKDGSICRGCRGEEPFAGMTPEPERRCLPELTALPVEMAVGRVALHDMTRVVPGLTKEPAVLAGQIISQADVQLLKEMGRFTVYVASDGEDASGFVHEDEAAKAFGRAMAGEGVRFREPPREGKITFFAARGGLLGIDRQALLRFNLLPGVICAARQGDLLVEKDRPFAACRAVPLFMPRASFEAALAVLKDAPLFQVLPLRKASAGILVTGTEVAGGVIEDKFIPVVRGKLVALGSTVAATDIRPDDRREIASGVRGLLAAGADLIVTTAGLSVDPGDVTRLGLLDAGLTDMLYGIPVLPGAMMLLGRIGETQVIGIPACALFHKTTALDLLLPRVLAGVPITRGDLAAMGEGGFCLQCKSCTFPKCPFGK